MKSPLCRAVAMIAWLLTALCALNQGLVPFGYDFVGKLTTNPKVIMGLHYTFGVAGLISLIMFVLTLMHGGCCTCGCDNGKACPKCGSCPCRCTK